MILILIKAFLVVGTVGTLMLLGIVYTISLLDRWLNTDEVETVEVKPFRKPKKGERRTNR